MKKITRLFLLLLCFGTAAQAQRYNLTGVLIADDTSGPLEAATIMLLSAKDSSLVNFGRSDATGKFEVRGIQNKDAYLLRITYVGYQMFDKPIAAGISDNPYHVGTIRMQPASLLLQEAVVKAEHIPVQIKKDTIEFNAQAFRTQPNDDVETLLKQLPGMEVESDGTVRAQGQQVQRVFVDGKEFFGNDPTIALKNLPAKAIDKVQVYDRKSEQAVFSGIDDGVRERTLNLTLKKDFKQGLFGAATAGYGNDQRYEGRANLNRFREEQQLSIIGMGNNINRQGFSVQDYMSFSGMARQMARGGTIRMQFNSNEADGLPLDFGNINNGFTTTWAGGLNFNNTWNKKTEVNGSYFFNNADRIVERDLTRQNFLPNGAFTSLQNSLGNNINTSHRLNLTVEHKIDSLNSLRFTSRAGYTQTQQSTDSYSQSLDAAANPQNEGERLSKTNGDGMNLNSELLYRHRFNKRGRTLSTALTFGLNDSDRSGTLDALNRYFANGGLLRTDSILQTNSQISNTLNYGLTTSYTEPLGKRRFLEFNYAYNQRNTDLDREVFDVNNGERRFNTTLSNLFDNSYYYHRGGLNFKISKSDQNFNLGMQLQQTDLDGKLLLQGVTVRRSFTNLLPNIRYNRDFTSTRRFNVDYETSVNEPSIDDLSPVIDNSDPLNIYVGNPALKPEYAHRLTTGFMAFNPGTFVNFFANLNLTYTQNRIVDAQIIDAEFVRTRQPVNADQDYMASSFLNFGFPIKRPGLRANISSNIIWMRTFNFINEVENQTNRLIANTTLRLNYRYKEIFNMDMSANLSYNETSYSLQASQNQNFLNQTYRTEFNLNLPHGFVLGSSFNYAIFRGVAGGFNQEVPIWSASVSKFLLNKRAELKLTANDILNQNVGINRVAQVNFIQDERIYSLGQYFMMSFTYSLQQLQQRGGGPGGMIRMIR